MEVPKEIAERRYGQWTGNEGGHAYNPFLCARGIYPAHSRGMIESQCSRLHQRDSLYCKQHDKTRGPFR